MSKEIAKDIFLQAQEHISKYLDVKDKILDNEYTKLAGDVFKFVDLIRSTNQLIINKKFNHFLKGFNENKTPTEEQIKKLIEYIDDESKAEFISDTFSKIILSNSSRACLIMGSLLKSLVNEGGKLDHSKLICISALTNFYDIDLDNFCSIFDYYEWRMNKRKIKPKKRYYNFDFNTLKRFAEELNLDYTSLNLTIEKAINYQLILRSYDLDIDVSYDKDFDSTDVDTSELDEYYTINSAGQLLYSYIKRIEI